MTGTASSGSEAVADLVKRLTDPRTDGAVFLRKEAACEIERLRAENERLAGLLNENGSPRFNEAMRRAEAAEARAASAEAEMERIKTAALTHIDEMTEIQRKLFVTEAERDALKARLAVMDAALEPFGAIADIFDQPSANRPREGEIMGWVDHRVGARFLTVEMLRSAREARGKEAEHG